MPKNLPRLTASRLEVDRYLAIQVEKGKEMHHSQTQTAEVDDFEGRRTAWDQQTREFLQHFFDSPEIVEEYDTIGRPGCKTDERTQLSPDIKSQPRTSASRPSALQRLNRQFAGSYGSTSSINRFTTSMDLFRRRIQWLESFRTKRLYLYEQPPLLTMSAMPQTTDDAVQILNLICSRFHKVAKQLCKRHNSDGEPRHTLGVGDEYDVQDLLHALLWLYFDDIRREEVTPSHAGGSGRVDFLLPTVQMGVETKMARKSLGDKLLGEELIIDIARFKRHPNCKTLYCFVYDPTGLIQNPRGIESDLNRDESGLMVNVNIAPNAG